MEQHELSPPRGARRPRKRVGRGNASGNGTYAGRGMKGQQARSGSGTRPGFEGGQTPLIRRLPRRRGFRNPFRVSYTPVNVRDLGRFASGSEVTPDSLRASGLVRSLRQPIKVLGDGELTVPLTVRTHRVSSAARAKIEAAGGTVEELTPRPVLAPEAEASEAKAGRAKKRATPAEDSKQEEGEAPAEEAAAEETS